MAPNSATTNGTLNGTSNGIHTHGLKYAAFRTAQGSLRIGDLDFETGKIIPVVYHSGTYIQDLYEVIETSPTNITKSAESFLLEEVDLLPPISGRDILAVGKNYVEHAREFNASGYDSSDKVDQPTHPVIFTKRATSIIAHGAEIHPHPKFTQTLDYEGEIGVILGKTGFHISESDAMDYVWGYTIINDVTAREKQRDHKQFFLGKSADTFCPMGPVVVAKEDLPDVLEITTRINGEQRQRATTADLIFSIPRLIATISLGQTLLPGDVIATGTPAGVGFGYKPPKWLSPGDQVEVSVTGLGSLANRVGSPKSQKLVSVPTHARLFNTKASGTEGLLEVGGKKLFYTSHGQATGKPTLFIHGLGGTHDYYNGLVEVLQQKRSLHLFDLEGHGLSPVSASSNLSIGSFAADA